MTKRKVKQQIKIFGKKIFGKKISGKKKPKRIRKKNLNASGKKT